jgi:hypothetical protein
MKLLLRICFGGLLMKAKDHSTRLFASVGAFILVFLTLACRHESSTEPGPKPQPTERRLQKMTSGERNVQLYTYDQQGHLASFHSDWTYADSGQTRTTLDAVLAYDTQQRISQITYNGSVYVKYVYEGNLVDKTEEYDHKNRLVITHFYLFNNDNQLVELLDQYHDSNEVGTNSSSYVKHRYEYDGQKNVQRVVSSRRRAGDSTFTAWLITTYENYDYKKNPNNTLVQYPFVHQACTQVNNPGKITTRNAIDQSINSVETLTYAYDQQGYPIRRTTQLTTTTPFPPTTVLYHYE